MKGWRPYEKWLRGCGALALIALLSCGGARALSAEQPPLEGPIAVQFVQRARDYVSLREAAIQGVPAMVETTSPVEISAREKLLANAIRTQRKAARQGDIFDGAGPPILVLVREDWRARPYAERAALWEEIPRVAAPAVNDPYPASVPLATFPPALLSRLPELPEELEYRFAGPHLILHDVEANMVVDVLPSVLTDPGPPQLGAEANQ